MSRLNKHLKNILSHEMSRMFDRLPTGYDGYLKDEYKFYSTYKSLYCHFNHQSKLERFFNNYTDKINFNWDSQIKPILDKLVLIINKAGLYSKRNTDDIKIQERVLLLIRKGILYNKIIELLSVSEELCTKYIDGLKFECCYRLILINGTILTTWDFLVGILRCLESHSCVVLGLNIDNDHKTLNEYFNILNSYFIDLLSFGDNIRKLLSSLINYPKFLMCLKEFNHSRFKIIIREIKLEFPNSKLIALLEGMDEKRAIRISSCFKSFGYVTIDIDESKKYFQSIMTKTTTVKNNMDIDICNMFKFLFIKSYYSRFGKMPNLVDHLNLGIDENIGFDDIDKLYYVDIKKNIEYDYSFKVIDMIKDTACMPGRHYVVQHFDHHINKILFNDLIYGRVKYETRRFAIKFLQTCDVDMKLFINNIKNQFPVNEMIIKYDVKLKEQKPKGRDYGTLTYHGKLLQISRINNLKVLIKYFDDYTGMVKNNVDLERLIRRSSSKLNGNKNIYFLMIDFKDYAGTFSYRNMFRFLKIIDDIFGVEAFTFFCELPYKCWHIKSFKYESVYEQFSTTSQFMPNGFDQYAWTINTICLVTLILKKYFGDEFSVTLTGDNCAIVLDYTDKNIRNHEKHFTSIVDILISSIIDNGQEVKPNEFMYSNKYFEYLKKSYYYGKRLREPVKSLQKVLSSDDSETSTINDRVASIFSSCTSACKSMKNTVSSYLLAVSLTLMSFLSSNINIGYENAILSLFSPSIFGRCSSLLYTRFLISGEIDPLTDWCYWIKVIGKSDPDLFIKIVRYNFTNLLKLDDKMIKKELILNPYYLPLSKLNTFRKSDEELVISFLKNNMEIKSLSFVAKYDREELLNNLCISFYEKQDPILMNAIYSTSNVGTIDTIISKITKTASFLHITKHLKIKERAFHKRIAIIKSYNEFKYSNYVPNSIRTDICCRTMADNLRCEVMGHYNFTSISTMHPLEVISIGYNRLIENNVFIDTSDNISYYDGAYSKKVKYNNWDSTTVLSPISERNGLLTGPLLALSTIMINKHNDNNLFELIKKIWGERVVNEFPLNQITIDKNLINKLPIKNQKPTYLKINTENSKFFKVIFENTPFTASKLFTVNYDLLEASVYLNIMVKGSTKMSIGCSDCIYKRKEAYLQVNHTYYKQVFIESSLLEKKILPTKVISKVDQQIVTLACQVFSRLIQNKQHNVKAPVVYYDRFVSTLFYYKNFIYTENFNKCIDSLIKSRIVPKTFDTSSPVKYITNDLDISGIEVIEQSPTLKLIFKSKELVISEGNFAVYNLTNERVHLKYGIIPITLLLNSVYVKNVSSDIKTARFLNSIVPFSVSVCELENLYEENSKYTLVNKDRFVSENKNEVDRIYTLLTRPKWRKMVPITETGLFNLIR